MRFLAKRDRPTKVHTGRAVAKQLAGAARAPDPHSARRGAFFANLGDAFFTKRATYSDGGPRRGGSKTRVSKSQKRRERRRDLERRRRTPGGAYLP